ncbi:MAG: hypothetical protein ACYS1A_08515 [Planctomycetota bacterium]|jgi:hypothetical protein
MLKGRIILILLVLAAGVQFCAAEEMQWLQYHSSRKASSIVGDMGSQSLEMSSEKPAGVELPEFKADKPLFYKWLSPLAKNGHLFISLDSSRVSGVHDILYIDSNGDGNLKDEAAIEAYRAESTHSYFGPVKVIFEGEDGPISYHLNFKLCDHDNRPLYVSPGGWYEGAITVAGVKKHCVLIDQNVNGTFNDKSIYSHECDRMRIGKKGERDTRFVGNYIEVDGKFYRPEIARDGAYIQLEAAVDIRFGEVELAESITEFSAGGENGLFTIKPEEGLGELPVGKYRVNSWVIERKDDRGNTWKLKGQSFGDKGIFEINESGQRSLATIGEPIISRLTARERSSRHYFDHEIRGQLDEQIEITRNGARPRAPKLHIKNSSGTYDRSFNFEYG